MVSSPDLIASEVESLTDEFVSRLLAARKRGSELAALSVQKDRQALRETVATTEQMNSRIGLLNL